MRLNWTGLLPAVAIVGLLAGCGSDTNASSSNALMSYKDTKSMVLDILKSEDGRKAVQEATYAASGTGADRLQLLASGDPQQLQLAVKDVLTDTTNNRFLQKMITDPRFAGQFAQAVQKDTKQIYKDLMKDPEYQKQLMDAMKSPEFERMLLETMKTTPYRTQMKAVIQESLQSPLFRLEMMNLMKKVLEEESMPKEGGQQGKQGKEGQGGGSQGGDGGGGEGGSDSGGNS